MSGNIYRLAERLSREDDVRIVGSIGVRAWMGQMLGETRRDGSKRNVNLINLEYDKNQANRTSLGRVAGFDTVVSSQLNRWITVNADGGVSLEYPNNRDLSVEVAESDEVFQPIDVNVDGCNFQTLDPFVLDKINAVMGARRFKDKYHDEYRTYIHEHHKPIVNPRLLDPFDEFASMMRGQTSYRIRAAARNLYQEIAPFKLRSLVKVSRWTPLVIHPLPPTDVQDYRS